MSLKDNFEKLKELGGEYFELDKEKIQLKLKIESMKDRYREGNVAKKTFSEYNKGLQELNDKLEKKKKEIIDVSRKINGEIEKEMQNVIG